MFPWLCFLSLSTSHKHNCFHILTGINTHISSAVWQKKLGKRFYREIKWKATNTAHLPHQHSVTSISKDQVLSTSVHLLFCLYLFLSFSYISFICLFHWLPSPCPYWITQWCWYLTGKLLLIVRKENKKKKNLLFISTRWGFIVIQGFFKKILLTDLCLIMFHLV